MCTDYRKLNQVTVPNAYPIPKIDEMIDDIGRVKYLTTIDLTKGYYPIFGFKNAPACYQRMMDKLLAGTDHVLAFIDDVVVYSDDWDSHLKKVDDVLADDCRVLGLRPTQRNVKWA